MNQKKEGMTREAPSIQDGKVQPAIDSHRVHARGDFFENSPLGTMEPGEGAIEEKNGAVMPTPSRERYTQLDDLFKDEELGKEKRAIFTETLHRLDNEMTKIIRQKKLRNDEATALILEMRMLLAEKMLSRTLLNEATKEEVIKKLVDYPADLGKKENKKRTTSSRSKKKK